MLVIFCFVLTPPVSDDLFPLHLAPSMSFYSSTLPPGGFLSLDIAKMLWRMAGLQEQKPNKTPGERLERAS